MRWWTNEAYLRKKSESAEPKIDPVEVVEEEAAADEEGGTRWWKFRVRADVHPGESIAVAGNCEPLGNWKHDKVFFLTRESSKNE